MVYKTKTGMSQKRVSVPFPGILFLNISLEFILHIFRKKFPSPSRGSYFSIWLWSLDCKSDCKVSVPFPGILFLNTNNEETRKEFDSAFPSPSRGSYFSIPFMYDRVSLTERFPSPSRGSYFSILDLHRRMLCLRSVSVPFPGILFLNACAEAEAPLQCRFRPLPGDLISQYGIVYLLSEN